MEYGTTIDAPIVEQFSTSLLGNLSLITAPVPGAYVVTIEDVKAHAKISIDDDNPLLLSYIGVATAWVEKLIPGHRQFLLATYDVEVSCWWGGQLKLPRPPLSSVTSVKSYDTNGTQQTLASTIYTVRTPWRVPGTVERAPDQSWPSLQGDRLYPITIRFVAGYGTAANVPPEIKHAIKVAVTVMYFNRGCMPEDAQRSLENFLEVHGYGSYG